MILATYFSWISLAAILIAISLPYTKKFFVANTRLAAFCLVTAMSLLLMGLSYWQYRIWLGHPLSKFFLPPYQGWDYFFTYIGSRIFAPYAISFASAVIFFISLGLLNRKFGERFFEREEIVFIAISIFLVGHPGWIFYLGLAILVYLALQIFHAIKNSGLPRVSMYYLWVPLALFVIIVMQWLISLDVFKVLEI